MSSMDDHVNMPRDLDDFFYQLLEPLCGKLTFACVEAAWESIVSVLDEHLQNEALTATREAIKDA